MSSFGVTLEGFVVKPLETILQELEDDEKAAFGSDLNTTSASVIGQLNSIFGDKVAELQELANATYQAFNPDNALGASFDNVSAITGTTRLAATKSTVTLRANLTPGTILTVGRVVSVSATGNRFVTTEDVSNTTGVQANITVEAESEEFGPIIGSTGTIDTIESPIAGWTAQAAVDSGNVEPFAGVVLSTTLTLKVDGEAVDQTVTFGSTLTTALDIADAIVAQTTGLDAIDAGGAVRITSDTDGAGSSIEITGGSANSSVILNFPTDLIAGMNDVDAVVGRDIESDTAFRIRREELLRISGAATVEAIRAAVREVENVIQALVFENVTPATDADGLPSKSIEVVVDGGDDTVIAQTIFDTKAGGIETFGDALTIVTVIITDSQGTDHTINFSRPSLIPMAIEVEVTTQSTVFGGGDEDAGKQQVREALALLGQQQQIGQQVTIIRFQCAPLDIAGVTDVPDIKIESIPPAPPPTNTANIILGTRDLATFDTSDIVVTITP